MAQLVLLFTAVGPVLRPKAEEGTEEMTDFLERLQLALAVEERELLGKVVVGPVPAIFSQSTQRFAHCFTPAELAITDSKPQRWHSDMGKFQRVN